MGAPRPPRPAGMMIDATWGVLLKNCLIWEIAFSQGTRTPVVGGHHVQLGGVPVSARSAGKILKKTFGSLGLAGSAAGQIDRARREGPIYGVGRRRGPRDPKVLGVGVGSRSAFFQLHMVSAPLHECGAPA